MMQQSESIQNLAAALAKAQGEVENAHKTSSNPHFRSKYADLAEIINTTRPVFTAHGLAVVQIPGWNDGRVTVETLLTHSSGEWIRGVSEAPVQKADPQGVGSATTYLRRYALAALCGIAQEDDDGNAASQRPQNQAQEPALRAVKNDAAEASEAQVRKIGAMYGKLKESIPEDKREWASNRIKAGFDKDSASKMIEWLTAAESTYTPAGAA